MSGTLKPQLAHSTSLKAPGSPGLGKGELNPEKVAAEKNLLEVNMQVDNLKNELLKLDNNKVKTGLIIRQKRTIESKLETLNKQAAQIKSTLRKHTGEVGE